MNFIVLAPNDWCGQWMNRQQLFSRIAKHHRVVYSTGPLFSWQIRSLRTLGRRLRSRTYVSDGVRVLEPGVSQLRLARIPLLSRLAQRLFARRLGRLLPRDGVTVLYLFHPQYAEYVDLIDHDLLVFHAYDDFSKQPSWSARLDSDERRLAAQADLILTSSRSIQQRYQHMAGNAPVQFVPNGVDYAHFASAASAPSDLESIPAPRVGYVGAINKKVDLALLLTLSERFPGVSWVLIGPLGSLDPEQHEQMARLRALDNVFLLGAKPVAAMPAYLHRFDVNLMCYRTSESIWASSGYPLKLHEYLAVGKPVVSSDIEAVREFAKVVTIARSTEEWITAIDTYLTQSPPSDAAAARQRVAAANTWECRVEALLNQIERLVLTPNPLAGGTQAADMQRCRE